MSESQPQESGLGAPEQQPSPQQEDAQSWAPADSQSQAPQSRAPVDQFLVPPQRLPADARPPVRQVPQQYNPQGFQPAPEAGATGKTGLTPAERFWYLLGNIALGAMYLSKVPAKKALSDFGLAEMTSGEKTWYTILCLLCGAGYFSKIPVAKAVSEMPQFSSTAQIPAAGPGH